jgi:hypothetical protein
MKGKKKRKYLKKTQAEDFQKHREAIFSSSMISISML